MSVSNYNLLRDEFSLILVPPRIYLIPVVMLLWFFMGVDLTFAKEPASLQEINRDISKKGKAISSLNSKIKTYKDEEKNIYSKLDKIKGELSVKREHASSSIFQTENKLKKQKLLVTKWERDAGIIKEQMTKLEKGKGVVIKDFEGLNIISQGLNRSEHNKTIANMESKKAMLQIDLDKINKSLVSAKNILKKTQTFYDSQKRLAGVYFEENNPEVLKLEKLKNEVIVKLEKARKEKAGLQKQVKSLELAKVKKKSIKKPKKIVKNKERKEPPAKKVAKDTGLKTKTWIYIVNGERVKNLGALLGLKEWTKTFDVNYIETKWGQISTGKEDFNSGFISKFTSDLEKIPDSSKLILIGHGLGGGAVIKAATDIAAKKGRYIDVLVALDPVGVNKLRANIVYKSGNDCPLPVGELGKLNYLACLDSAKPRQITPNIKYFYNRWQKNGGVASDKHRNYTISDGQENIFIMPSSTGKFQVESTETQVNQMRFFTPNLARKNSALIKEAGKDLYNLLIPNL